MKKLFIPLLFLVILFSATNSMAQKFMSKGSILAVGSVEIEFNKQTSKSGSISSETNRTSLSLSPSAIYFLTDDLGLGGSLALSTSKVKDGGSNSSFLIGPIARYYFAEGPFAQVFLGVGSSTSKFVSGGSTFTSKDGLFAWELGAGYSIRISDTVLLDPIIGYGSTTATDKDDSDFQFVDSGLFIRLAFTVVLVAP